MKLRLSFFLQLIFIIAVYGQDYNEAVSGMINQVNLDSLVSCVRILSGEDSVIINDSVYFLHRNSELGNDPTAEYLKSKLISYNLEVYEQVYRPSGKNIYAVQRGTSFPEKYFIYCAHYDAVYPYAADDNASGTANVIEAARILSNYELKYSVIYALWDEEEFGKWGSEFFADSALSHDLQIIGVINSEMSGYDSDNDGLMDIHTRNVNASTQLAEIMNNVNSIYSLSLDPVIYNPGTNKSDHEAFWLLGYSAIEFCQAYYGKDYDPYAHSFDDRIDKFNLEYFHNMSKLGIGTLATLAIDNPIVGIKTGYEELSSFLLHQNYPNPFNPATTISYSLSEENIVKLKIYDLLGKEIAVLVNERQSAGSYKIEFDASKLSSGVYIYKLQAGDFVQSKKMILMK